MSVKIISGLIDAFYRYKPVCITGYFGRSGFRRVSAIYCDFGELSFPHLSVSWEGHRSSNSKEMS